MNRNQQQLINTLLSKTTQPRDGTDIKENQLTPVNISHAPPFENFDPNKEIFKYYRQRFENYIKMKDIYQDKKRSAQMLLNSIGASNYNILAALVAPTTPGELDYEELIKELEKHLAPRRSTLVSQHYFLSTYQQDKDSIADFVASLRRDIADCEFKAQCECGKDVSASEIFLRAQFIRDIKDTWIKEQILQSEIYAFNDILTKAIALEASKTDCHELSKARPSTTTINVTDEVHKVSRHNYRSRKDNYKTPSQNRPRSNQTRENQHARSKSRGRIDYEKLGINNVCLRCGRNNHLSKNCRTDPSKLTCTSCHKTGHVSKICIKTLLENKSNNTHTNHIDNYEDFGINRIVDIYDQPLLNASQDTTKYYVSIKIEGAKPSFTPERNVPYALQVKVENELDTLEAEGIISKAATSDWGSPLVVIPKGDGTVRLCVDYKVGVNDQLVNASYPIKRIEDVLNSLKDSKYFFRLDLYKAYLHLRTDEESSIIQTISTHRETYRMNRLSFGIKTAPAEFNRVIDQILQGLNKTISYFDDILVHGKSKQECKENLFACLERLRACDLHLNKNKCIYFQTKIEYLGHVIENNKISKSPSKVKAIIDMPQPKNIADLRRFLGMLTYYSRFLPDVSTITYPLRRIFHPKSKFPKMTSARLLRYASFLAGFDYVVSFKKGTENQIAECLSRAPTAQVNGEILFKNDKVVVPKSLQLEVLKDLHSTHLGIVKMKQLARRYCTWKNINKDIKILVKSCKDCLSTQNNPPKAPVHHWDPPSTNWERIHLDYAGPFQGYYYLVLIDAKSRWAEIKAISEPPTSLNTIKLLNDIFSTHGYPFVMVSDNASIFTGDTFSNYCLENGIRQKFIAPGHPATNGLAERNIQTLKNKLKSMINENVPIHQKIQKILLRYRATPLTSGKSPSEMYLNRQIRIKLDAMRPYQEERSQQQIQPRTRCLQLGNLHYIIELDEGKSLKRHINQLQKVEIKKKQVTFDESTIHHQSKPSQSSPDFDPIQYTVSQPKPNQQEHHDPDQTSDQEPTSMPDTPLRRSQRPRRPPRHLEDYMFRYVSLILIVFSTVILVAQTMDLQVSLSREDDHDNFTVNTIVEEKHFIFSNLEFFSNICTIFFMWEYALHFLFAPNLGLFLRDPYYLLHFISFSPSIVCFTITLITGMNLQSMLGSSRGAFFCALTRALRLVCFARSNLALRTLLMTFTISLDDLKVFVLFVNVGCFVLGFLIHIAEFGDQSEFDNLFVAYLWALSILTTVGTGFSRVKKLTGVYISSAAQIFGVFLIGFPVGSFQLNFIELYNYSQYRTTMKLRNKASIRAPVYTTLDKYPLHTAIEANFHLLEKLIKAELNKQDGSNENLA
ncbi:K02A2.6-like [Cordylochernes scorpioides]|uniref:RNA-directed DNA polymerase n=1 Tax=Cordylochernes scorpioides TaxID=51811 RepID=A0ABY6LAU0_9ARAC|nr:K02A2.6-like [Cordylochernes scorpioides]